jgi:hypothetical protein
LWRGATEYPVINVAGRFAFHPTMPHTVLESRLPDELHWDLYCPTTDLLMRRTDRVLNCQRCLYAVDCARKILTPPLILPWNLKLVPGPMPLGGMEYYIKSGHWTLLDSFLFRRVLHLYHCISVWLHGTGLQCPTGTILILCFHGLKNRSLKPIYGQGQCSAAF